MPSIVTHYLLGENVLDQLATAKGEPFFSTDEERDAFMLGNQGPDPLFFCLACGSASELRRLGRTMHRRRCVQAFDGMRTFFSHMNPDDMRIGRAWTYGFLCHQVLDRTAHPLVYSLEYELLNCGIEELRDAPTQIHGQIEADLDSMMLWREKSLTICEWRPYVEALKASDETLAPIDRILRFVAVGTYGVELPNAPYTTAIHQARIGNRALWSPTGRKRIIFGKIERLARPHSLVQAMSQRPDIRDTCDFDNRERRAWVNPFTGEVSNASFLDLFEEAAQTATEAIQGCEAGWTSEQATACLNFRGEHI